MSYRISNGGAGRDGCRWHDPYSRRERQSKSGGSFPGVRSRRGEPVGPQTNECLSVRLKADATMKGPAEAGHYEGVLPRRRSSPRMIASAISFFDFRR
jgi:hypothetical protein